MSSTPSNRLKLTPSNSPFLHRSSRSPVRSRPTNFFDARLSLKRVIGTTCSSPTGFDTVQSSFAYIAGGAVVVVDVEGDHYSQRFYRARPTAVPVYSLSLQNYNTATPTSTPKANDSRNRVAPSLRDSYSYHDWSDSPTSKTWTSRERIKAATCLALSSDGRFLAVGETGYSPRVLIFNLQDSSSDIPLVSISEHNFGVKAVAWSEDGRYLSSLGAANDGFLYLWKIDTRTGAAKLFQQNRCTAYVRGMVWVGSNLVTFGVRHVKVWRVEEPPAISPIKQKFLQDNMLSTPQPQRTLPGRNILLGSLLDATFSCAAVIDESRSILCSESGDVCVLDDTNRQMKLTRVMGLDFGVSCMSLRDGALYIGSKAGQFTTLKVDALLDGSSNAVLSQTKASSGLLATGFLSDKLITIDSRRSIDIWKSDSLPGQAEPDERRIPIPGHGDAILGVQALSRPNDLEASYFTWSGSGKITLWDLDGRIKSTFDIPVEQTHPGVDSEPQNQLTVVRATKGGKQFIAGDKLGVLKTFDFATKECVSETKAHSSDCHSIAIYEDECKCLIVSSGRDRTAQLFHRNEDGIFEHLQTLEFPARVVQVVIPSEDKLLTCSLDRTLQVHDLVTKEGEPDVIAAISSRTIPLKASPTSMTVGSDDKSVYVSLLDRSVSVCDITTGRLVSSFKGTDEGGIESVVLDSLIVGQCHRRESPFLLAMSNTDKSVRLYDAQTGFFVDREWGHTESINGVTLVDDEDRTRKVVSVGSDGTLMVWSMDPPEPQGGSTSRDPSPVKDLTASSRPPLRRVLSKAELAEFQRSTPTASGRRSPPRSLRKRPSRYGLTPSTFKTPVQAAQASPNGAIAEDTPFRRTSSGSRSGSPPVSPKAKVARRPSLPALSSGNVRKRSNGNLRGFGTVNMATEQACRTLRAYRKKLASSEPISQELLAELDQELRLTAAALGDRAIRSKAMNETVLSGLLDQYSERLVSMLDEKLRLSYRDRSRSRSRDRESRRASDQDRGTPAAESRDGDSCPEDERRPRTAEAPSSPSPSSATR
ncbi:hypothetical protein MKZ38_005931 [Zalerion maritima]|uniref:Mitogen-activated protein kinase-binding protein 1 n=1 Tax=Zalerion maritima TaxID=339359 RepID=A0AAD5RVR4_9PEZI|nr:hypothetical protein MKZ38_005931 [Zalerion maritima]